MAPTAKDAAEESVWSRQDRRGEVIDAHVAWLEEEAMLPSMRAQLADDYEDPDTTSADDPAALRPDGEKANPRVLWEYNLVAEGAVRPTGMLLCGAAPTAESFEAFVASDPYAQAGFFASTRIFKWNQVCKQVVCCPPHHQSTHAPPNAVPHAHSHCLEASMRFSLLPPPTLRPHSSTSPTHLLTLSYPTLPLSL